MVGQRTIAKALAPLVRRLRLLTGRCIIRLVDDARLEQEVQVGLLAGETGRAERYQHYGFTSVPLPGCEGIHLAIGGNRDHLVTVADGDRRHRLRDLEPGEVALYTDEGDSVIMRRGNIVEINTRTLRVNAATKIELLTPQVESSGQIRDLSGSNTVTVADMRTKYNDHTHPPDTSPANPRME